MEKEEIYVNKKKFPDILNEYMNKNTKAKKIVFEETTFKELELRSCQSKIARNFKEQKKGRYTNE